MNKELETNQLTIYKASAGSGKTFRLVLEYLKLLCSNPYNYKHILAVTFTNKATSEMKDRIISALYQISTKKENGFLPILISETGLSEFKIIENSYIALSNILHNYDRFAVSTIDSFFQRVLRSFARESGLYGAYEINLDQDAVIEEACDRLLLSVEDDKELRQWLLTMAEDQLEDGKSWQITGKILELGKELYNESFQKYLLHYESIETERSKLKELKKELVKTLKWFEKEIKALGQKGLNIISSHGLESADFSGGKSRAFTNYFNYLSGGRFDKLEPTKTLLAAVNNVDKWYTKTSKKKDEIIACYNSGLNDHLIQTLAFIDKNIANYNTASELLKLIYSLGVLTTLLSKIHEISKERNSLLLNEGNLLLKGIIGNNDAPFVYEKTGTYYHYFMIDEFQDTSITQWDNLRPLVDNSLSENHPNLVVGDIKQSIYRWRNGDWQLLNKYLKQDLKTYPINEQELDTNWRSSKNIVEFNNAFFEQAKDLLQNDYNTILNDTQGALFDEYRQTIIGAYSDVSQKSKSADNGGFVQYSFIPKDDYEKLTIEQVVKTVKGIQDKGYRASDIAILVKKNKQGKQIAEALLSEKNDKYNLEVISDDTLYIDTSASVRFLANMMQYILSPYDKVIQASVIYEYSSKILPRLKKIGKLPPRLTSDVQQLFNFEIPNTEHHVISDSVRNDYFPFFTNDEKKTTAQKWSYRSLIELIEELIGLYHLDYIDGELAPLQAFKDVINDFSKRESGNLHQFIEWWKQFGNKVKLQSAGERDAIQIMTIHKSKGLEFPIVILPFCDWQFAPETGPKKQKMLWCSTENSTFKQFPILPVKYSKRLAKSHFSQDYFTENLLSYIDNVNVLYVAQTRAVKGLYVFSKKLEKDESTLTLNGLNRTIIQNCQSEYIPEEKQDGVFSLGELKTVEREVLVAKNEINLSSKVKYNSKLNEALKLKRNYVDFIDSDASDTVAKINEGKLIHELLSLIDIRDDIDIAIDKLVINGKIEEIQRLKYHDKLVEVICSNNVEKWFNGNARILNEATMIAPNKGIKRPDRVMIFDYKSVEVVDYKLTDKHNNAHKKQVQQYVSEIKEMGYENVTGFVWYLKSNEILNVETDF